MATHYNEVKVNITLQLAVEQYTCIPLRDVHSTHHGLFAHPQALINSVFMNKIQNHLIGSLVHFSKFMLPNNLCFWQLQTTGLNKRHLLVHLIVFPQTFIWYTCSSSVKCFLEN